ncbi:hypothetical protein D3C87_1535550 [compost metagenome]
MKNSGSCASTLGALPAVFICWRMGATTLTGSGASSAFSRLERSLKNSVRSRLAGLVKASVSCIFHSTVQSCLSQPVVLPKLSGPTFTQSAPAAEARS